MSDKKQKSWLRFFLKTALIVAVFFTIVFTVLAFLGGNSETLKGAIEDFSENFSGYPAEVETLHHMGFYPYFSVDLDGLSLKAGEAAGADDLLHIEKLQVAMDFWDMTFTTGNFKTVNIENLGAVAGFLLPKTVKIDRFALFDPKDAEPSLQGNGEIGTSPWSVRTNVERRGRNYGFGKSRKVEANLADLHLQGTLEETGAYQTSMQNLELKNAATTITGELAAEVVKTNKIAVTGELELKAPGGQALPFRPNLLIESAANPVHIGGQVFAADDRDGQIIETALRTLYDNLAAELGYEDTNALPLIWDVEIKTEDQ